MVKTCKFYALESFRKGWTVIDVVNRGANQKLPTSEAGSAITIIMEVRGGPFYFCSLLVKDALA